jgi:uncharacterized protein (DUF433 family)
MGASLFCFGANRPFGARHGLHEDSGLHGRCYHRVANGGQMAREYVKMSDGNYRIGGSRVTLESVILPFLEGASPESLVDEFPTLSLEQVYGVITFYLAHRTKVDAYLRESERAWKEARESRPPIPAGLRERLRRARSEFAPT